MQLQGQNNAFVVAAFGVGALLFLRWSDVCVIECRGDPAIEVVCFYYTRQACVATASVPFS